VRSNSRYEPYRLFHDVVIYTVTVGAVELERLIRNFRAYGYAIREDGGRTIATGPEFTLIMLPERAGEPRTASIEIALNREKTGEQNYRIGDAELQFAGKRAALTFHFPPMKQK
jgi:hypothetical protein